MRYVRSELVLFCKAGVGEVHILLASYLQIAEPHPPIYAENELNKEYQAAHSIAGESGFREEPSSSYLVPIGTMLLAHEVLPGLDTAPPALPTLRC